MQDSPHVQELIKQIVTLCSPLKILVFSIKVNLKQEVTSFKLCVVAETADKRRLETDIYLSVDCELPFDVVVYTSDEWEQFTANELSFASSILGKGVVVYDQASS